MQVKSIEVPSIISKMMHIHTIGSNLFARLNEAIWCHRVVMILSLEMYTMLSLLMIGPHYCNSFQSAKGFMPRSMTQRMSLVEALAAYWC